MSYIDLKTNDVNSSIGRYGAPNSNIKPKNKSKRFALIAFIFLALIGLSIYFAKTSKGLFDPISVVATFTAADLKETDGRTNILILGSDKRDTITDKADLTDTILVASIGRVSNDVVLISIPRDLWVQSDVGYNKINAIYAISNLADEDSGGKAISNTVNNVLGIPIHYYAVVDFKIFEETIDTLGGVTVNVEQSFTDNYYPIEGKETAPEWERYETIKFTEGMQNMDGATALKYVRSRKGDNNEGTDFARAKRQQKVIMAIKEKASSLDVILNPAKVKELYDTYASNVDTNMNFSDIQGFYLLSKELNIQSIKSVILDDRSSAEDGGLLYAPTDTSLYGGAYVLIPQTGDFGQIHAYVQKYLFGEN